MSGFAERISALRADLRQLTQRLRARLERARESPYRRRRVVREASGWQDRRSWIDDHGAPPPAVPPTHPEGVLSRPRTVHEATERLRTARSLIRRQRTRRAL